MKFRSSFHRNLAGPAFALAVLTLVTGSQAATIIKAADGTTLATTKTTLKANPIVTFLAVSYKF